VHSLQLICFKIANHKHSIIKVLEKYIDSEFQKGELSEDEDDDLLKIPLAHSKKMHAQKKISLNKLMTIMDEICKAMRVKLVTYEQFLR
jgi:hypothetical protein